MNATKIGLTALLATCTAGVAGAEPAYLLRFKPAVIEQPIAPPPPPAECAALGERCADGSRVIGFANGSAVRGRLVGGSDRTATFGYAEAAPTCAAGGWHVPAPAETGAFGAGVAILADAEGLPSDQYYWTTHEFWGTHQLVEHRSSAAIRSTVGARSERWRILCVR